MAGAVGYAPVAQLQPQPVYQPQPVKTGAQSLAVITIRIGKTSQAQTPSAEAGAYTSETILREAQERLTRALEDDKSKSSTSGTSHCLSPVRRMELVENRLAVVLNQDSEQARKFVEPANHRLTRLKSHDVGVPVPKSKAELDKQQARMVQSRRVGVRSNGRALARCQVTTTARMVCRAGSTVATVSLTRWRRNCTAWASSKGMAWKTYGQRWARC